MLVIERNHESKKSTSSATDSDLGCCLTDSRERKGISIASACVVKVSVKWEVGLSRKVEDLIL